MELPNFCKVSAQMGDERGREDRDPILSAFAVANQDAAVLELQILGSQPQRLGEAQAASVQQYADEPVDALQIGENALDILLAENGRQAPRASGSYHIADPRQIDIQHAFVEKQQRRQRLALRGGRNIPVLRQVAQEVLHFLAAHQLGWRLP